MYCGSHPILSESGLYLFWLFLNKGLPILGKGFSWLNPNLFFPITELFVYKSLHLLSPLPTCYLLSKFYLTFPTQFTHLLLFLWNLPRLCFPKFISLLSSNICITHLILINFIINYAFSQKISYSCLNYCSKFPSMFILFWKN